MWPVVLVMGMLNARLGWLLLWALLLGAAKGAASGRVFDAVWLAVVVMLAAVATTFGRRPAD